ncbi:hypothetical protein GWK47_033420 [Chionoecetes opilio]|uniref:Uncharacterized protein n=1 Tax=Chionoecetes opilio TaxID=41210 RepID=A0A8J4YI58_CHIOP|nr:hypothetical protein GWK47_033420 [Chionoecetes opilio]
MRRPAPASATLDHHQPSTWSDAPCWLSCWSAAAWWPPPPRPRPSVGPAPAGPDPSQDGRTPSSGQDPASASDSPVPAILMAAIDGKQRGVAPFPTPAKDADAQPPHELPRRDSRRHQTAVRDAAFAPVRLYDG